MTNSPFSIIEQKYINKLTQCSVPKKYDGCNIWYLDLVERKLQIAVLFATHFGVVIEK